MYLQYMFHRIKSEAAAVRRSGDNLQPDRSSQPALCRPPWKDFSRDRA